jgi:hypothetical protein
VAKATSQRATTREKKLYYYAIVDVRRRQMTAIFAEAPGLHIMHADAAARIFIADATCLSLRCCLPPFYSPGADGKNAAATA